MLTNLPGMRKNWLTLMARLFPSSLCNNHTYVWVRCMKAIERRSEQRVSVNMPMIVSGTNSRGESFHEVTSSINVSPWGIYFPLNQPIDVNCELVVTIVRVEYGRNTRLKARGRVVRRDPIAVRELSGSAHASTNIAVRFLEHLQASSAA